MNFLSSLLMSIMISRWSSSLSIFTMFISKSSFRSIAKLHLSNIPDSWKERSITSETNEKVKHLTAVVQRKKKYIKDLIVLEGHRMIIDAISAGFTPQLILITDRAISAPLGEQLVTSLLPYSTTVSLSNERVISKIADTVTNQGVLGLFSVISRAIPRDFSLVVICDNISDPGNLGSIVRASYGFGADAVITVGGVDPWSSKAIRSSMGMILRLPVMSLNWTEISSLIRERERERERERRRIGERERIDWKDKDREEGERERKKEKENRVSVYLSQITPDAVSVYESDFLSPCVLVIGSEGFGISSEAANLSGATSVYIPMSSSRTLESLNAASAASILLAETCRQREREK